MTWVIFATVGVVGIGAALAIDALFGAAADVAAGARLALSTPPPSCRWSGGMDILHVCSVPSDIIRGQQIGALLLLLGGVPTALIGAALQARGVRWTDEWGGAFVAGLMLQLGSLTFTAILSLLLIPPAVILAPQAAVVGAALFLPAIACNVWGVRSWRALQTTSHDGLLRIT